MAPSTKTFPEIIAWKPFEDSNHQVLALNVVANISGAVTPKVVLPFFVTFVACRDKKKFTLKDKAIATKVLKEGRCNSFMVVYNDKKQLKFEEIELKQKKQRVTKSKKPLPSYFG